jgi:gluconolactonase
MKRTAARAVPLCLVCLAVAVGIASAQQQPPLREVTITAIPGVVNAGSTWTLAWAGTDNADGIVGAPDGGLLFAQEQPNRVSKLDKNDKKSVFVEGTHGAGSLSMDTKGRIFAAERTCTDPGRPAVPACAEPTRISIVYPEKERRVLADSIDGKSFGRPNDLVADKKGGAYFTSGGAFYVSAAGKVTTIGENLRTNGIMLSADEKTLYITNGMVVVALDVQPDGSVKNQRDFAHLDAGGNGDGMAIDATGRLYVTSAPGVQVFSAEGKYLGLIPTLRAPASVAFAGSDKKTLYVTGAGALGPDGKEIVTAAGVRNNAKSIFRLPMVAQGFKGRPK